MEINLRISEEAIKDLNWAGEIALENAAAGEEITLGDLREALVPFMVDGAGQRIPEEMARKLLGRIKASQSEEVGHKFVAALRDFLSQRESVTQATSTSSRALAAPDGSTTSPSVSGGAALPGSSAAEPPAA